MASLKQVGDLLLISHYMYEEHILTFSSVDIFVLKSASFENINYK